MIASARELCRPCEHDFECRSAGPTKVAMVELGSCSYHILIITRYDNANMDPKVPNRRVSTYLDDIPFISVLLPPLKFKPLEIDFTMPQYDYSATSSRRNSSWSEQTGEKTRGHSFEQSTTGKEYGDVKEAAAPVGTQVDIEKQKPPHAADAVDWEHDPDNAYNWPYWMKVFHTAIPGTCFSLIIRMTRQLTFRSVARFRCVCIRMWKLPADY